MNTYILVHKATNNGFWYSQGKISWVPLTSIARDLYLITLFKSRGQALDFVRERCPEFADRVKTKKIKVTIE